ncbi:tRNA (adenosine(37)-N6)-threonylcarbamoyltransferase complex ATPase subunit type 1 TsaE [Candidatus Woesebacteria bacterium]|nr:tRNA (adenosine(37)-N6)-threonylcarbamoyltransferase complex ATPase subunit type 1 TsaE [Candidatus Woesebacteria bacterium]
MAIILDAGVLPPTLPTTIVDARGETPLVLRQGGIQFSTTELHHTFSAKETQDLGVQISTKLKSFWGRSPIIFALTGEMGSGKTHFTKGIAAGLRIPDLIKSPSYAFVHEYTFTAQREALPFLHVDAWRLENPDELDSLGLARALSQSGIVAIEWAALETEFFQRWKLKAVCVHVDFSSSAENERTLRITTSYPESEAVA